MSLSINNYFYKNSSHFPSAFTFLNKLVTKEVNPDLSKWRILAANWQLGSFKFFTCTRAGPRGIRVVSPKYHWRQPICCAPCGRIWTSRRRLLLRNLIKLLNRCLPPSFTTGAGRHHPYIQLHSWHQCYQLWFQQLTSSMIHVFINNHHHDNACLVWV